MDSIQNIILLKGLDHGIISVSNTATTFKKKYEIKKGDVTSRRRRSETQKLRQGIHY